MINLNATYAQINTIVNAMNATQVNARDVMMDCMFLLKIVSLYVRLELIKILRQ